jgi:hypothetical protein
MYHQYLTPTNRSLETFLQRYLLEKARTCNGNVLVRYSSGFRPPMTLPHEKMNKNMLELEIEVLSPAFFSRLTHYSTLETAFEYEGFSALKESRTVQISSKYALHSLLGDESTLASLPISLTFANRLQWNVLKYLRQAPSSLPYSKGASLLPADQAAGISSLDAFVASNCIDSWLYRRSLTRLFLAQRVCLGLTSLIDLSDFTIRAILTIRARWSILSQYGVHAWAMMKG